MSAVTHAFLKPKTLATHAFQDTTFTETLALDCVLLDGLEAWLFADSVTSSVKSVMDQEKMIALIAI